MDRLRAMETFTRVVRAGSFSAAAQQLRVSRTIVSKHVSQLENLLGVRLLNRTTRRISLTETGIAYFELCSRILNEVEEAELSVTKLHKEPRGALKVLAPKSFGLVHVAPAVCAFSKRYPDIKVAIVLTDSFVDLMDNGFDLAIKVGALEDSSLVARRLGTTRLVACASPAYLAAHGTPQTPQDLAEHNCMSHLNQVRDQTWHFTGPEGPVPVKISGGPAANSVLFLRHAALDDIGIALLPEINIHDDIQSGGLVPILTATAPPSFPSTWSIRTTGTSPPRFGPSWIAWWNTSSMSPGTKRRPSFRPIQSPPNGSARPPISEAFQAPLPPHPFHPIESANQSPVSAFVLRDGGNR